MNVRSQDSCYLSEHKGSFGELDDHLLSVKCIIQLDFEIFDLGIRICELDESRFKLRFMDFSCQAPCGQHYDTYLTNPPRSSRPSPCQLSACAVPAHSPESRRED
jgi:hypothetical protein